jgi:hypothetical protein
MWRLRITSGKSTNFTFGDLPIKVLWLLSTLTLTRIRPRLLLGFGVPTSGFEGDYSYFARRPVFFMIFCSLPERKLAKS